MLNHRHGFNQPTTLANGAAAPNSRMDSTPDLVDRYGTRMRWHNPGPVRHPPGFIEPCLPTNGQGVPSEPDWACEVKHDGSVSERSEMPSKLRIE